MRLCVASFVAVVPCLAFVVCGGLACGGAPPPPAATAATSSASPAASFEPAPIASVIGSASAPMADELVIEDVVVGTGTEVKNGDAVTVNYTGKLLDGTVFDSSYPRKEPFSFIVGSGTVIRGWDKGLLGMRVGGKRKLRIPGYLAYGRAGSPPHIPADATLLFDIELLHVVK